jgi:ADP-ribose pyrophosphatase YjhB (NUDIX family)
MVKDPVRGWELPGGQVEVGETLTDAFIREIKEETGIDIEVGNLISVSSNIGIGIQYDGVSPIPTIVTFGFNAKAISGELTTSEETLEVKWVDKDQVLDLIDADFTKDRTRYMLNFDGKITYFIFSRNPYVVHGVQHI